MRLRSVVIPVIFSLVFILPSASGEQSRLLTFIHREGEVLHADSHVNETVTLNGYHSHQAVIEEFSVSRVVSVDDLGGAQLESRFRTVEQAHLANRSYQWLSEEQVSLHRDKSGLMTLPETAVFPVIRSLPRFPDYPVAPGDSWSLPAEEVHVFRMNDGLHGPYRGSLNVYYRYLENTATEVGTAARIAMDYNVYLPVRSPAEAVYLITGQSSQEILWDIEQGRPIARTESFEFMMMTADGNTREFLGTTRTDYRYTRILNRDSESTALREKLDRLPGVRVESADQGILLSLNEEGGRIFFQPESSLITEDQKQLLKKIARVLEDFEERDILITGHTAAYGTAAGRERLSLERAGAVAEELFPEGRPGTGRLFLRGAGSSETAGKDWENRRVDILILD